VLAADLPHVFTAARRRNSVHGNSPLQRFSKLSLQPL
jgi:hypothetical protein